jgi:quinol monooxygenase YgiN
MAIAIKFEAEPTTREKYDQVRSRLEEAGNWPAPGVVFHAAYGESDIEGVFEVWESRAAFEEFGSKLMPLLAEVGINAGEPQVLDVYKMDNP